MSTTNTQSLILKGNGQGKVKQILHQKKIIFEYSRHLPSPRSMVSDESGVPKKSICRYRQYLEKDGLLYEIKKKHLKPTDFRSRFVTTNTELFPKSNQLTMSYYGNK